MVVEWLLGSHLAILARLLISQKRVVSGLRNHIGRLVLVYIMMCVIRPHRHRAPIEGRIVREIISLMVRVHVVNLLH